MARPHIIFLVSDQLRYDAIGPYGNRQCPTPNLDRLSRQAAMFDRHYTTCPLGIPSRGTLLTGLPPAKHGAIVNGLFPEEHKYGLIDTTLDLLPNRLADADYNVQYVGVQPMRTDPVLSELCSKVKFRGPAASGQYLKLLSKRGLMLPDMSDFRNPVVDYRDGRPVVSGGTSPRVGVFPLREDLFYDSHLTQQMVKAITTREDDKPLALLGNFWLPHPPLCAPRKWAEGIDPMSIDMPGNIGSWYSGMPASHLQNVSGMLGSGLTEDMWRLPWAVYLGMVAMLDHCIGKLFDALEFAGMWDDTAIIFTSNHGEMLGSHRLFGKNCLYEEAVRVPLIVKLPGQSTMRRVNTLSDHTDLVATLCDLAGTDTLNTSEGRSLRVVADGGHDGEPKEQVFAASYGNGGRGHHQRMVRTATHKFIHNIGDRGELYDMIEDPRETRNLEGRDDANEIEKAMREALASWMEKMGDDQPYC